MKFGDRTFTSQISSDILRDGISLEAYESSGGQEIMVGEVFFSDQTMQMTVSLFEENLPLELIEFMGREARECLVPVREIVGGNL